MKPSWLHQQRYLSFSLMIITHPSENEYLIGNVITKRQLTSSVLPE